jgi:energy-converting hydrogenase Eha subunit A
VYTSFGICHAFMMIGCWQDRNLLLRQIRICILGYSHIVLIFNPLGQDFFCYWQLHIKYTLLLLLLLLLLIIRVVITFIYKLITYMSALISCMLNLLTLRNLIVLPRRNTLSFNFDLQAIFSTPFAHISITYLHIKFNSPS